jgi:hypothetical protein
MRTDTLRTFLFGTAIVAAFVFVLSIVLLPPATMVVALLR